MVGFDEIFLNIRYDDVPLKYRSVKRSFLNGFFKVEREGKLPLFLVGVILFRA